MVKLSSGETINIANVSQQFAVQKITDSVKGYNFMGVDVQQSFGRDLNTAKALADQELQKIRDDSKRVEATNKLLDVLKTLQNVRIA